MGVVVVLVAVARMLLEALARVTPLLGRQLEVLEVQVESEMYNNYP